MSGTRRQVIAYAPDGGEVTWVTAAGWTVAGLILKSGTWTFRMAGHSDTSVLSRTRTCMNRHGGDEAAIARIWDCTAPVVAGYFGTHRVVINAWFTPADGWTATGQHKPASRANIRRMAREGVIAVNIKLSGGGRQADFQMTELLASLNSRKA
jgi:hypothetical protein